MPSAQVSSVPNLVPVRPYQEEAGIAVKIEFRIHRSTLVHAATGVGKTRMAKWLIQDFINEGKRCLFLVDTDDLVRQSRDAMMDEPCSLDCGIEKAEFEAEILSDLVIASIQTLRKKDRLHRYPRDNFDLIVIDEAHGALSNGYSVVTDWFEDAKIVGYTATPGDDEVRARSGTPLLGHMFESIAYTMDMRKSIDAGWLVPIQQKIIRIEELDYSNLDADSKPEEIDEVVNQADMIRAMAESTIRHCGTRQAIIFCASVEHAYAFTRALKSLGVKAECIEGNRKRLPLRKRQDYIERTAKGEIQFLVNCQTLNKGIDIPSISAIVFASPMVSAILYEQRAGRGTRPICPDELNALQDATPEERRAVIAASAKPNSLMIDFAGNNKRFKLCRAAWALDHDISDIIAARADRIAARDGVDVTVALTMAEAGVDAENDDVEEIVEEIKPIRRPKEPNQKLLDAVALPRTKDFSYTIQTVDPFTGTPSDQALSFLGVAITPATDAPPATEGQVKKLADLGVQNPELLTRDRASMLISEIGRRRRFGLADHRQIHILASLGQLSPEKLRRITAERAARGIAQLEANAWVRPESWGNVR